MTETGQHLIDAFFKALVLKQQDRCQTLLHDLDKLARQEPVCRGWHTYLRGTFINEFERNWAESEQLFQAVLAMDSIELYLRGCTLRALGVAYDYQGRWAEALQTYDQSLSIFKQLGRAIDQAKVLKNMAIVVELGFAQGEFGADDLSQAVTYGRLALARLETVADVDESVQLLAATIWNTLILLYLDLGNWEQAKHCCEQCIALSKRVDDRYGVGMASNNLGEVLHHQGPIHWPEALTAYRTALEIYREFEDIYEEIDVRANLALLYRDMGDVATALAHYEQAIALVETLRAEVSSEMAQAGFFATVVNIYAHAILLHLAEGNWAGAFDMVERARSRAFLDSLIARSPDLAAQIQQQDLAEATTMTLAEVQAALPPETLLLEYFTTGLVEIQAQDSSRRRVPPVKTLLFAVTRDAIRLHEIAISPNDLHPGHLDSVVERHFLEPQMRRMLYKLLIEPVADLFQDKRCLYLVPHGPLHYIPFQALIASDGETLLRADGPRLIYGFSATLLFRYGRTASNRASKNCLAVGYNSDGATPLLLAEAEARSVARLTGGQALVGPSPKKASLYRHAADYRLLHLACHGEFDPHSPLDSFLQLAPTEKLTALDILEKLRLQCDLVTLSACDSGLSRIRRGDELIGLMRAVMYAGTPALVSTLWRVYEQPTRILMERFYEHLQGGLEFAEALKRAQLYVKELTYQEAMTILTAPAETPPADETDSTGLLPTPTAAADSVSPVLNFHQATAYLRGAARRGQPDVAQTIPAEPDPDYKIFADPYYWAAFILIGDHVA